MQIFAQKLPTFIANENKQNKLTTKSFKANLLEEEAKAIEVAVQKALSDGLRTHDIARGGEAIGTEPMGSAVVERLTV